MYPVFCRYLREFEYLDYMLYFTRMIHGHVEDYITIVVGPKTALLQSRLPSELSLFSRVYDFSKQSNGMLCGVPGISQFKVITWKG